MRESTDRLLEYIDGVVYMSPSPSTTHQRISGKLYVKLFNLLEGKGCEVFSAPYDIELHKEEIADNKIVIPDITVICDKKGIEESKFVGVPTLIIEIVSPSNQANDLVVKLNLYMKYGVQEYWIVNPILNTIQVYYLNEDKMYEQLAAAKDTGFVSSKAISGFNVELGEIFL
jgi:Uncharacterized protein conserved in cyanobacteria